MPQKSTNKTPIRKAALLSVAPMMDWTDRHCRYFHRQLSKNSLLYTEMVTAPAIINGDRERLLGFDATEHPVAVQLGGSNPAQLQQATAISCDFGYDEVNLNCGCPSDRVQSGYFGAVLMAKPDLVAECVSEMKAAANVEITVKCRIGVDDQDPQTVLPNFLAKVSAAGVTRFTIHARKAWLQGLSPKENRDIPPLDYDIVHQMKAEFPHLHISINGGVTTLEQASGLIEQGLDGVMIGRAAYHQPADILCDADELIFSDEKGQGVDAAIQTMLPYIENHLLKGGRLNQITRHMLGAFAGKPGARRWRRHLSEFAHKDGAGPETVLEALAKMREIETA
ncbi:tRNA-dihydrouridine synthase A [Rhodobacterales bacterium HTCC2150]|nr:tRNA-dihydrouridine synthase A [Rhodobacterales bacterium HTCC2150] [Rhodobacteraceae bacterium HTCC2150]